MASKSMAVGDMSHLCVTILRIYQKIRNDILLWLCCGHGFCVDDLQYKNWLT